MAILFVLALLVRMPLQAEDDFLSRYDDDELSKSGKDKFVGGTIGYHEHSLETYKRQLDYLNKCNYGFKIDKLDGETYEGEIYFGVRMENHGILVGLGGFPQTKAELHWSDGVKGETTIDAYFIDCTYRYYFLPKKYFTQSDLRGLLLPYIGGGVGYYQIKWAFNDSRAIWSLEGSGNLQSPSANKDTIGYHLVYGVEKFIDTNISVNLQGGYRWADSGNFELQRTSTTDTITYWVAQIGGENVSVELDGVTFTIGINYHWK
ncbi:MAG: hypothetical protein PHH44_04240 [bacterium]|nr:hypothetical protein [bacterium]